MICHYEKNVTKILSSYMFHIYFWTHIKTLKFPVRSLILRFPNEKLYILLYNRKGATCSHHSIFLKYSPLCTAVDQYKSCSIHCAHSCTALPIHTTLCTFLHSPTNPPYIVHIPAQPYKSTQHFPISLTHSTLPWNIVSLRAIQGFGHDAANVRVMLGYELV